MKLCIASVALGSMHPRVALGLSSNMFYLGKHMPEIEVVQYLPERMELATARNFGLQVALDQKCDYFFWLDDDTILLTKEIIYGLLTDLIKEPGISMISPAYYLRSYPYVCMAFKSTGPDRMKLLEPDEEFKLKDEDGIVRGLKAIGNGCTMMNLDIVKKMELSSATHEWYRTGRGHTEDAFFCAKAASVDPLFQCAIDTRITAAHILNYDWVHLGNLRYKRLKVKLIYGLATDDSRYKDLEDLIDSWGIDEKTDLTKLPLELDSSVGRM